MGTGWRKGTEAEEEEGLQGGGQIVRGEWVERRRRERERHRPELLPLLPFDSSPPRERQRGAERRLEEEREGGERRRRAQRRRLLR